MKSRSLCIGLAIVTTATTCTAMSAATERDVETGSTQRKIALVVAGIGVTSFAAGVIRRERMKRDDGGSGCSQDVCSSMGSLFFEDARAQSGTAFRMMAFGAIAMVSGIAIYVAAPTKRETVWSRASVGLGAGGITFKTVF